MNTRLHPQLTMHVEPHPASVHPDRELYLIGGLKIAGTFSVDRDLQAGDQITVSIANADGEIVAKGVCEMKAPHFKVIEIEGEPIGMERIHTAKVEK